MTSNIQLLSLFVSFIYGILFYFLTKVNFLIINKLSNRIQFIITFIYTIDMVIIYSIIMYKINNGYLHIYFIAMVLIGFIITYLFKFDKYLLLLIEKIKNKFT